MLLVHLTMLSLSASLGLCTQAKQRAASSHHRPFRVGGPGQDVLRSLAGDRRVSMLGGAVVDDALLDVVLERLGNVPLADEAASLLLAACESDASLSAQLSGESAGVVERSSGRVPADPAGAYLRSVSVSGFRGVGHAATLELEPGPGLTLVVGRNGSGKSSFADGLEALLTGALKRWQELSAVWQDGWRNLHAPDPALISAELLVEGAGPATAERRWTSGAGFADSRATVQFAGKKRGELDDLGWRDALVTYRPFLSHSELEAFFNGPSRLYDLLSSVLGLEDLTTAANRLATARRERKTGLEEVNKELPNLRALLGSVDDERARSCLEALTGTKRVVERALAIATGSPAARPDGEIGRLRQLSQVPVPSQPTADQIVAELRAAADALDKTTSTEAGKALAVADLLSSALDLTTITLTGRALARYAAAQEPWMRHGGTALSLKSRGCGSWHPQLGKPAKRRTEQGTGLAICSRRCQRCSQDRQLAWPTLSRRRPPGLPGMRAQTGTERTSCGDSRNISRRPCRR